MPIWNKYKIIKEIDSKSNIKTYLTRIEPIVKEVKPKNKAEHYKITERLEKLKEELNIYEIIEEDEKIYIVLENNEEALSKVDKLLLYDELNIKKEAIIKGHDPITKEEIMNLFKLDKSMCKIKFETKKVKKVKDQDFFVK